VDIVQLQREKELALAEGDRQYGVNVLVLPFKGPGDYPIRERTVVGGANIEGVRADVDASGRPTATQFTALAPVLGDGVTVQLQTLGQQARLWNATAGQVKVTLATPERVSGSFDVLMAPVYANDQRRDDSAVHLSGSWACQFLEGG
jgi:hypothetical protein